MTTAELNALISRHGGLASAPVATNATIDNPDKKYSNDPDKVPNPNPDYKYTFNDGTDITLRATATSDPNSATGFDNSNLQVVDAGTALKPASEGSTEANSPQLAAQRAAEAAAAQALADQRKAEDAQRARNKADSGYGVTDAELARLRSDAASQNLTQQQVDLRARELEQSGQQRGRELDIAAANNKIAEANQALATKRLELDQIVRDDASKLDWAKFEYLKTKDAADNQIATARLDLERLAQDQTAANQTTANVLAQQTLEQRKVEAAQKAAADAAALEQRKAEQQTTIETAAQTAATQGATGQLGAIAQGAQTGAGLLQNRVTNAQNFVQQGMGLLGQTKHGLLVAPPSDFGQNLVSGAAGFATELGGGPEVYQAAANLVRRADPNGAQGQDAAAAYSFLTQMFQKYREAHGGQPHPAEVAGGGGGQKAFTAPGYNPNDIQWNQPANAANVPGRVMGPGGVITGGPQPVAVQTAVAAPPRAFAQSGLPEGRSVVVPPTAQVPMPEQPTFVAPQQQVTPMQTVQPASRNITITVPTG